MFRHVAMIFGVLSFMAFQAASATATYYVTTTLPDLVGGHQESNAIAPVGINNSGQVVGSAIASDGETHPYLWSPGTGAQDLGLLSGATNGYAHDINDSGHVVGYTSSSSCNAAFYWSSSGGMQVMDNLGGTNTQACGINNSGQVTGYGETTSAGQIHAWFDDSTLTPSMQDIYPDPEWQSAGDGINNNGQIAGHMYGNNGEPSQAFFWDGGTMPTPLGDLGGGTSRTLALNDSGQVVGYSMNASGVTRAFLWTSAGGMQDLGGLEPTASSYAAGINASGQVTGWAGSSALLLPCAVLYSGGEVVNLNTKIRPGLFGNPFPWLPPSPLTYAYDINDSGQIVATAAGAMPVVGVLLDPAIGGDANLDGSVNGSDLNAVLSNYNGTVALDVNGWMAGDFNNDGFVNGSDLNTVLSNYNRSLWSSSTAAVPEPSTLLLAVLGLVGLLAYRRVRACTHQ